MMAIDSKENKNSQDIFKLSQDWSLGLADGVNYIDNGKTHAQVHIMTGKLNRCKKQIRNKTNTQANSKFAKDR